MSVELDVVVEALIEATIGLDAVSIEVGAIVLAMFDVGS